MKTLKIIGIALAICSLLLFGIPEKSDAASITEFIVYAETDYGSGASIDVSVKADENIDFIDWYIESTGI